jgi:hypothetical protein
MLMEDWRGFLNGTLRTCTDQELIFERTADKYLSIILSLLTGASVIVSVSMSSAASVAKSLAEHHQELLLETVKKEHADSETGTETDTE